MTTSVGGLYDALLALESRRRGDGVYAVHKKLKLVDEVHEDVYDWVAEQLDLKATDRVLDAGCGVGFGTLRLAARGVARVTGITVSAREHAYAVEAAARNAQGGRSEFFCRSFDELPVGAFDVVVAVESLKHSANLDVTLRALQRALAPGGRLAIVEDVFSGDRECPSARQVASDWLLARLYTEADYLAVLSGARVVDLTSTVRSGSALGLAAKLGALGAVLPLLPAARATALRAFRGGLHLEKLYAAGAMRYVAFLVPGAVEP